MMSGDEVAQMEHVGWVQDVSFSPDGQRVVSGSNDGTVRVWEVATGQEVSCLQQEHPVVAVVHSVCSRYCWPCRYGCAA